MLIYVALAVMPAVLAFILKDLKNPQIKRDYLIICGILLFLFMGLRSYSVGSNDTFNYINMMKKAIHSKTWHELYDPDGVESGFQMFLFILSRVFADAQWLVVISSALYVILTFWFISRNSEDVALSVTIYITLGLMTFHMQGMRQSMAMSLCLIAYELSKRHKFLPFLLVIGLAATLHQTAIVFVVIYFISRVKFNAINVILAVFAALAMFYMSGTIINVANSLFDMDYVTEVDSGGVIATAIYALVLIFALFFNKRLYSGKHGNQDATMFYITFLGFVLYSMRYVAAQQVERISFYFMFGQMILLPNSIQQLDAKERVVIKLIVYLLIILLFLYRINGSEFMPYRFFWQ